MLSFYSGKGGGLWSGSDLHNTDTDSEWPWASDCFDGFESCYMWLVGFSMTTDATQRKL